MFTESSLETLIRLFSVLANYLLLCLSVDRVVAVWQPVLYKQIGDDSFVFHMYP